MKEKFPYLGEYEKREPKEAKDSIECMKCVWEYNCPCLWSFISETCLKIQREVKYDENQQRNV